MEEEKTKEGVRVAEALKSQLEGRVTLRNVSWETYERLVTEREERRVPRFFYDRGVLEIVSPSFEHETLAEVIASIVKELALALGLDVLGAGSTRFGREDVSRGFEPDASFYFSENARRVRGKKRIDLDAGDPPPDLVIEVDVTSSSLDKLPIYARIGVPEVWRHDGERLAILGLRLNVGEERGYAEIPESALLTPAKIPDKELTRLVEEGLASEQPAWMHKVREWTRELR